MTPGSIRLAGAPEAAPDASVADRPLILALESSCDETSAAVLRGEHEVLGHLILSQDVHRIYGGVVPELAARAHIRIVTDVVDGTLREAGVGIDEIDVFAATAGPGLIGALLVGLTWAKAAAYAAGKPLVAVHHMEAHLFAVSLEHPEARPPFVALLVSGGHTMLLWVPEWGRYELLGETRDDAAGEAFDKVAKILGLGYPGGPVIQRSAAAGDPAAYAFPRPLLARNQRPGERDYYDFSYSGLKTAVFNQVRALEAAGALAGEVPNLAASFQAAAIDLLVAKTLRAVEAFDCPRVVIGGGVAASRSLRDQLAAGLGPEGELYAPSPRLATDNAAMVARAALFHYQRGDLAALDLTARADLPFPGLVRR
jgi:N6-L-threonylcarbamoyladenine synthase